MQYLLDLNSERKTSGAPGKAPDERNKE